MSFSWEDDSLRTRLFKECPYVGGRNPGDLILRAKRRTLSRVPPVGLVAKDHEKLQGGGMTKARCITCDRLSFRVWRGNLLCKRCLTMHSVWVKLEQVHD